MCPLFSYLINCRTANNNTAYPIPVHLRPEASLPE